jgi:carbon storage regulator
MLVLERRVGESIMIGDDIEVRLVAVKGKIARIAISAPRDVTIYRDEVYNRIKQEQPGPGKLGRK